MAEEKYIQTLEWLVEHLKSDLEKTHSELDKIKQVKDVEIGQVLERIIDRLEKNSQELHVLKKEVEKVPHVVEDALSLIEKKRYPPLKAKKARRAKRFDYKKFIEEKLIRRESFTLKDIRKEFKLPRHTTYELATVIKKNYSDKFDVKKNKEGIKIKAKA